MTTPPRLTPEMEATWRSWAADVAGCPLLSDSELSELLRDALAELDAVRAERDELLASLKAGTVAGEEIVAKAREEGRRELATEVMNALAEQQRMAAGKHEHTDESYDAGKANAFIDAIILVGAKAGF